MYELPTHPFSLPSISCCRWAGTLLEIADQFHKKKKKDGLPSLSQSQRQDNFLNMWPTCPKGILKDRSTIHAHKHAQSARTSQWPRTWEEAGKTQVKLGKQREKHHKERFGDCTAPRIHKVLTVKVHFKDEDDVDKLRANFSVVVWGWICSQCTQLIIRTASCPALNFPGTQANFKFHQLTKSYDTECKLATAYKCIKTKQKKTKHLKLIKR